MSNVSCRNLNLQEYASKELMNKYDVNVQKFGVANTPQEASDIGSRLCKQYYCYSSFTFFKFFFKSFKPGTCELKWAVKV